MTINVQCLGYTAKCFKVDSVTPVENKILFQLEKAPVEIVGSPVE